MAKTYWLMKTEPDVFSFDDLVNLKNSTDHWDGIRNYQARNFMRDQFKKGQQVFIYHSNTKVPGIVGIAEVVREAYPDHTALDPKSKYFDPKSADKGESRWVMVDVKATHRFRNLVSLADMREMPELDGMALLKPGQRLSIQPVEAPHWSLIKKIGKPEKLS
ncbi:EVE domain-containing protein [Pseudobacteriovorax antillogorgiicola]|uniref:Predicted RNA-binding protein, contains PUA-like domain n=1 Tax=Pseudobacteriovorax antillogorgiicola TaxID=1513793 RepID=A0A1Y6C2T0_9BACT|nr:EVE domain-containing protein [Pseudobacteriovorax antillogorgiicola]TCS50287.1 putative RNA-binding protein with PUA-like domain [Pseudobacteriovorax antillogorgiicola]SMF33873.1 Predicted RNA-binding protein, contains PUA-like domain [Pseudobacteriovorax antillogorgiicola]